MVSNGKQSKPVWQRITWPLARIALLLAAVMVLVFACQSKLVYFPTSQLKGTPDDVGLTYEIVWLTTTDKVRLHGWYIPAKKATAVVLFNHGNGGNISHRIDIAHLLNNLGLSVLMFDYRGYGKSQGSPNEQGTYLDAEAAWQYLTRTRGISPDKIVIYGRSLGGAIAAHLAVSHPPGILIVDSTFTSLKDVGQEIYPFLPVRLLSRFDYPTKKNVSAVRCPVLVIHSPDDDLVPFHHGKQIFDAAKEPKKFLKLEGGHNDNYMVSPRVYGNGIKGFIDAHLAMNNEPKNQ